MTYFHLVVVYGEHLEAAPVEQVPQVLHLDEGGDVLPDAALALELRQLQRGPQLEERLPAKDRPQEGALRPQHPVDLAEDPRQVVDPVQAQAARHQVNGGVVEGEPGAAVHVQEDFLALDPSFLLLRHLALLQPRWGHLHRGQALAHRVGGEVSARGESQKENNDNMATCCSFQRLNNVLLLTW